MNITFIYKNELKKTISKILHEKETNITFCIDRIDNFGIDILKKALSSNKDIRMFIGVSNQTITKSVLKELYSITENMYYFNNNDTAITKNDNIIVTVKEDKVNILFVIDFEGEHIENSDNISILVEGTSDEKEISILLDKLKEKEKSYIKVTEEVIDELEDIRDLRNDKATTLTNIVSRDEIKRSFRKIKEVDDSEAFIKMIEMNNEIKYKGDDVIIGNTEDNNSTNFNKNDDIEIDLGE